MSPAVRMCAMEGDANKLFCALDDGDNVNFKVSRTLLYVLFSYSETTIN